MNLKMTELKKQAAQLPLSPGVYIMKNSNGDIIYIGKAKALRNRVSQYFGSQNKHTEKVRCMVGNVDRFEYIITDSEFEALVLECSLIKQHKPKYNILLKDDKGYHYIRISKAPWRMISAEKQKPDDGADYIGPFTGGFSVTQSVAQAQKIYRLPSCRKVFPRDIKSSRPCLNFYLSQCSAPCAGKVTLAEYEEAVDGALEFLRGGGDSAVKSLRQQMEQASDNQEYEKAARLRDRINALNKVREKQKVVSERYKQQDVFAIAESSGKVCLMVLRFENGRLCESEHFIFDDIQDLPQLRSKVIIDYYSMRERIPPRITLDGEVEDSELLCEWLQKKRGKKVVLAQPERGEQAHLVSMCLENAQQKLLDYLGRGTRQQAALGELSQLLGLSKPPEYIESYDISHTAGSDNVAGMVVFRDGKPLKSAYRRFSIKGFTGQDDYASMAEVLSRRLDEYEKNKASGEGFGKLPDLILLDGGQGQVNAVLPVVCGRGYTIPVFGMVKDNKHRTSAIANGGGRIEIDDKRRAFTLVSEIQEEVHRFAVSYHRQKHGKSALSSTLLGIDSIGEKRAKLLLQSFKTISAVKEASVDELAAVKGMTRESAINVYEYFRKK
ncbi:MAG: excinuclease ABC subunit UvrC [Clostridiales bacterium]|nr:excinuclease ABC subunit UvrC [Clostridiales bacterium]